MTPISIKLTLVQIWLLLQKFSLNLVICIQNLTNKWLKSQKNQQKMNKRLSSSRLLLLLLLKNDKYILQSRLLERFHMFKFKTISQ